MSQSARDGRQDFLRAVAIIAVVAIHSAFGFDSTPGERGVAEWLSTFLRPCIAVFLFVTGYFFPLDPTPGQMGRRFRRILVPYFVFTSLALLYQTRGTGLMAALAERPLRILQDVLTGNTWGVYWFIPIIVFTLLGGWVLARPARRSLIWIAAFFLVTNLIIVGYVDQVIARTSLADEPMAWFYLLRVLPTWPVYFFFGRVARVHGLVDYFRAHRPVVLLIWLFVFLAYNGLYWAGVSGATGSYRSIIDTLYSLATIAALNAVAVKSSVFGFIGRTSYATYLAHYFFVSFTQFVISSVWIDPPFWMSTVVFGVALGGSLAFNWATTRFLGERARQFFGV